MKIVGTISSVEIIAEGRGIRELSSLRERFGGVNWKKKKGIATLLLPDGETAQAVKFIGMRLTESAKLK
jgi:hypothetical protein